ncbi:MULTISPECIES: transporter substrate-binding domain-containing protein [unclassified Streptococcus]|uniref:transporter substrate-binding domain-containing protein n=1 Tax=unclassified Streptococcus TaxID=2608887 RepID=UPI001072C63A|nr:MULTISPECIES: transporter substrate-binding domain-containing protein [unclassified Streptococcus]MBF0786623.1 transporter substrate-binding domain-containing protein [Streptococcus sp. 19428wC2_LYSM12]MCQ9212812.1 transporter substrate-binding domain-containing protein [Streptococcus sp. B01]MCQ9214153.1 transporter substrate-binding domain-containing protein [Streptococcus sp. O1]TFV06582.1 transporter substrate-binding domain-containing protein [Streptococcus sp. LYSM12]
MKWIKIMTGIVAIAAGVTLAACGSSSKEVGKAPLDNIKEKGTLVVATSPDYAPFEFQTLVDGKNKIVGADILMAEKIAEKLGVRLEVSSMSFDNVLNSIQNGRADIAIAGLSVSEDRMKVFDFSEPYYHVQDILLVKKDVASNYSSLERLVDKKLAVQKGSTQEVYAKEHLKDTDIISLTQVGEAINELKSGQVDAVLLDSPVALGYVSQNKDLAIAEVSFPETDASTKAIVMPKDSGSLKEEIDKIVKELIETGEYEKYLKEVAKFTAVE